MSDPLPTLPAGEIEFFDGFQPGLKDGTYRIDVTQSLSATGATINPVAQTFVVQGPRFALDPTDVHMVFPPRGATSTFEEILPHVVLTKRLLPWERDIPGLDAKTTDQTPWLALLVFTESELLGEAAGGTYAQTIAIHDLLAPQSGVRKPQLDPKTINEDLTVKCQAIQLKSDLFAQIVPTARELQYLAHAREVNTGDKVNFGLKDDGWFSVVVANRFPAAGTATVAKKSIVHLVSLEGFGDLIAGTQPTKPAEAEIQLVSLANWTFSCLANPAQTFGGLAQNLAYDPAKNFALRPTASLVLRLPFTPTGASDAGTLTAQQRLTGGYVALGYHAPSGEDGFAWYRGPCSAVVSNPVPTTRAFQTADAAMIYDPATGIFDLSLATAWQAGRSLAIANEPFATALMRVRIAANAVIESADAPTSASVHQQLARLFSGGVVDQIADASSTGVPPLTHSAPAPKAAPPPSPAVRLRTLLAEPGLQAKLAAQLKDSPDAQILAETLGEWLLLRQVPFVHLVPDARMLPAESIRFFYLDPNWVGALLDGALSVGLGTSRESAVQEALTRQLEQMALAAALAWRAKPLGLTPPPAPTGPTAGFLLRSALASGWPGLNVSGTAAGKPVPLLRLEHVGPSVLFALFNGVPDTVVLSEPQEGLEFGVSDTGHVDTRKIKPGAGGKPSEIVNGASVPVFDPEHPTAAQPTIRQNGQRVLNLAINPNPSSAPPSQPNDLLEALAKGLSVGPATIGPAVFGVQMVKGPEQLVFTLTPPPKPA
jgi:hypothetical protein